MSGRRAVFLDKDGTLVENVPYNVDPGRIRLTPGAAEGLRRLHAAGFLLVVISNQAGVARGYFPEQALGAVEARLRDLLGEEVPLTAFYWCPHHPEGSVPGYAVACDCRKPAPGMLLRACQELNLDAGQSWMVGDILHDIEAGRRAGCRTVLIDNGSETEWDLSPGRVPDYRVPGLAEAAAVILAVAALGSSSPVETRA